MQEDEDIPNSPHYKEWVEKYAAWHPHIHSFALWYLSKKIPSLNGPLLSDKLNQNKLISNTVGILTKKDGMQTVLDVAGYTAAVKILYPTVTNLQIAKNIGKGIAQKVIFMPVTRFALYLGSGVLSGVSRGIGLVLFPLFLRDTAFRNYYFPMMTLSN